MPNRILRDWTDSLRFDGVSAEAERLFVRLIMKADDWGRYHAEPRLLKAGCFPLENQIRPNDLDRWLDELSHRQLILRYEVQSRTYLVIQNFKQRTRSAASKFPPPDIPTSDTCQSSDRQMTDTCTPRVRITSPSPSSSAPSSGGGAGGGYAHDWPVTVTDGILRCYPAHRRGRPLPARAAIAEALDRVRLRSDVTDPVEHLRQRTLLYAKHVNGNDRFVPAAAKWFSEGGYDQDESEWQGEATAANDSGGSKYSAIAAAERTRQALKGV